MKSILRLTASACLLVGFAAPRASADITYTYTLVDVKLTFANKVAGTLSGTFTTNEARTQLLAASIAASAASVDLYGNPAIWPPTVFAALTYNYTFDGSAPNDSENQSQLNGTAANSYLRLDKPLGAPSNSPEETLQLVFADGLPTTGISAFVTNGTSHEAQTKVGNRLVASGSLMVSQTATDPPVPAVPEPSTIAVVAICAPALLVYAQRRRRQGADAA